jgi:hypothetical protein
MATGLPREKGSQPADRAEGLALQPPDIGLAVDLEVELFGFLAA